MEDNQKRNSNSFTITNLRLFQFRNYQELQLDNIGKLSIFIGENAVGKTSIIEAIQLLTDLKSFRSTKINQLITWGKDISKISLSAKNNERVINEELTIHDDKKRYIVNNKQKRIQDLKGLLPAVIFTPDDLYLIKGSHSIRRDSLDNIGIQLSQNFYSVLHDYQKLIKQKNQALKEEMSKEVIESINEVLAKVGVQYIIHRTTLLNQFLPYLQEMYAFISHNNETLSVAYCCSWDEEKQYSLQDKESLKNDYEQALSLSFEKEVAAKRSRIGPHADTINFFLSGKNAYHFASQGQIRSIVLAYKMAELQLLKDKKEQQPFLLLDDVMSELDAPRRDAFMNLIEGEIQTFITTTNLSYFTDDIISRAHVYNLPFEGIS